MYYFRSQLEHYQINVIHHKSFQDMSTISELCWGLAETNKSQHYHLNDKLIRLVLTLPVSTATTEQTFSTMKHVKTVLRNKIKDEFLADSMMIYIERELIEDIDLDSIIYEFYYTKHRRVQLWLCILFLFLFLCTLNFILFYILCYVFGLKLYC